MGKASRRKKDLVPTKVKGRIGMMRLLKYKPDPQKPGVQVYIRKIDEDIVEYMIPFNGDIYSDYMIFTPGPTRKSLTEEQLKHAEQIIIAGAFATVDHLLGIKQDAVEAAKAKEFLKVGEEAFEKTFPDAKPAQT